MVVGPVGAGKSSLLAAVLGEMVELRRLADGSNAGSIAANGGVQAAQHQHGNTGTSSSSSSGSAVVVAGEVAYTAQVRACLCLLAAG